MSFWNWNLWNSLVDGNEPNAKTLKYSYDTAKFERPFCYILAPISNMQQIWICKQFFFLDFLFSKVFLKKSISVFAGLSVEKIMFWLAIILAFGAHFSTLFWAFLTIFGFISPFKLTGQKSLKIHLIFKVAFITQNTWFLSGNDMVTTYLIKRKINKHDRAFSN